MTPARPLSINNQSIDIRLSLDSKIPRKCFPLGRMDRASHRLFSW